jgi:hypothetical protein
VTPEGPDHGFAGVPHLAPRPAADLRPLLHWLRSGLAVTERTDFPAGTVLPDGRLDLCKSSIGPEGVAEVAAALRPRGPVKHLLLGTDALGDSGADEAARGAVKSGASTLYLGCNGITPVGACRIADRLIASPGTVSGLWLKRNPLGGEGARAAAELLGARTELRTLDLVQTGVDGGAVALVADALRSSTGRLERLYLSGNPIGPNGSDAVAELIEGGLVDELYVSAARLGDAGALSLAAALRRGAAGDRRLRRLSVASNGIGPDAIAALAEAAAVSGVELLDCGRVRAAGTLAAADNHVDEAGAAHLGAALAARPHRLCVIDLRHTGMTSRGALALLDTAQRAATPTRFLIGSGVASRVRRELNALASYIAEPAVHPDVAAIRSVHRTA